MISLSGRSSCSSAWSLPSPPAAFEQTGGGVSSEEQEGRWRRYFRSDQDKVMKKVEGLEAKIEGLQAMLKKLLEAQNLQA